MQESGNMGDSRPGLADARPDIPWEELHTPAPPLLARRQDRGVVGCERCDAPCEKSQKTASDETRQGASFC